jgi:hypothetical protein
MDCQDKPTEDTTVELEIGTIAPNCTDPSRGEDVGRENHWGPNAAVYHYALTEFPSQRKRSGVPDPIGSQVIWYKVL